MPASHQPPNNIPLASSLPKVSFRRIPASEAQQLLTPAGVQDQQHINFGFNDGSEFEKPEHYLRYVEPIDSELNKQVEYDMDEQDQEWLDALNLERRRDQQDAISYELFEIIIDRLEKEWFDLMKRVPVKPVALAIGADGEPIADGIEDTECAICDDGECENSNAIVFCDGCNLAVHQDCYGIPYIPEGQWLCRKCTVSPDRAVSCVLCPHEGGAFKQTTQGKWAHLLCAMWIPETGVSNPVYMEPIDSVERVPKARWRLQCYLCKHKVGACIQCDNKNCFTAFHVTCARKASLLLKSQRQRQTHSPGEDSDEDESEDVLRAWCHKHLPKSLRAQRALPRGDDGSDIDGSQGPMSPMKSTSLKSNIGPLAAAPGRKKSARAYKKSYRAGPSLVPVFVMNRVLEHLSRIHVRKKPQLAIQVAKFWSLKREARRGAPLLKRLHLEPWTASRNNKEQSEKEVRKKHEFQYFVRTDLEKMRMLAELVRKREKEKLKQVQIVRTTLVDGILFPYHDRLRKVLERVSALDRTSLFLHPVSRQNVPDYYDIVQRPMDWTRIAAKIDDFVYTSVAEFKEDINLVLDNAMLYNKLDTHYHRTAARVKKVAGSIFEELDRLSTVHGENEQLQLEAEDGLIDLLQDYTEEERKPDGGGAEDAIEELVKHFYHVQPPSRQGQGEEQGGEVKLKTYGRKAAEKAARKDRARLAAQKRKEGREANAARGEAGGADGGEGREEMAQKIETGRSGKRQSAIKASMASLEARKRRAEAKGEGKAVRESRGGEEEESKEESQSLDEPAKLEVDKVNGLDWFMRFNSGWVLPEGTKRQRGGTKAETSGQEGLSQVERASSSQTARTGREASSDLSDLDDDEGPSGGERQTTRAAGKRKRTDLGQGAPLERKLFRGADGKFKNLNNKGQKVELKVEKAGGHEWEPSTLCWAKVQGHAFYPAEVFDEESDLVPEAVLRHKFRSKQSTYLVRFFDTHRSFGWIPSNQLKLLFEDDDLDERMLKEAKTTSTRTTIRLGYERAKAEAEA